jgi:hypothetical protein
MQELNPHTRVSNNNFLSHTGISSKTGRQTSVQITVIRNSKDWNGFAFFGYGIYKLRTKRRDAEKRSLIYKKNPVIQHAKSMRRIILPSEFCPPLPCFFRIISKGHDFRKEKMLNLKSVLRFSQRLFSKHFSFYEELGAILSKMYIGLHVQYRLLLSDFNETWIFSTVSDRNISHSKMYISVDLRLR